MKCEWFQSMSHRGRSVWCLTTVNFVIAIILSSVPANSAQSCNNNEKGFIIKRDHALLGDVIETLMTHGLIECLKRCVEHGICVSANYAAANQTEGISTCELNSAKVRDRCLVSRTGTSYYELRIEKEESKSGLVCQNNGIFARENCHSFCKCILPYSGKYCENFYPVNCKQIQDHAGMKQDGEYEIYLPINHRLIKVYCADMASNTPLEYVSLPAGTANNFARYYNKHTHRKQETSFEKVRLNLKVMQIVTNDYRFATTNTAGVYRQYASAGDCKSYTCTSPRSGAFKVDLSGTSFRLPSAIPYKFFSYPSCAKKLFSKSMDSARLRWSATCGGRCGDCRPEYLKVEFNE